MKHVTWYFLVIFRHTVADVWRNSGVGRARVDRVRGMDAGLKSAG